MQNNAAAKVSNKRSDTGCGSCPITTRRDFVREATAGVSVLLASIGSSRSAFALPVSRMSALARNAETISYAIPTTDGVQIDKKNEVILVRWQNAVYAFNLACPHQKTILRWNAAATEFQCPKHKSKYTPHGEFISGKATRGMDRLAIRRAGQTVIVDVGQLYEEDENEAEWKLAVVRLA